MKKWMNAPFMSIFFVVLVMSLVCANLNWGKNNWKSIIRADAKGYYAYLPAVFIYQDLNFGFFDRIEKEKYYDKLTYYDYRANGSGKTINKYYVGTALCQAPFFFAAHFSAWISGSDMDGYSKPYMLWISISGIFYLLIGLIYLNKLLKLYEINPRNRAFTILAMAFGSNLFYYVVGEPGLSHIYSFAFMTLFFYWSKRFFEQVEGAVFLRLCILLALIFLIRPANVLVFLSLPFFAGSWEQLKNALVQLLKQRAWLIAGMSSFLLLISLQGLIYKVSTGSFFVYSYGDEGFNWLRPHFFDILFSYKKGLFLYTPLFLLSLFGFRSLWTKKRFEAIALGLFLLVLTYVLSSWWNWWYGGSFSSRVYLEYLPLFALLLALALGSIKSSGIKKAYITLIVLLVVVCQIQIFQYRYYDIHWENMNKEKYWDVFLRVDRIKD